jgi:putative endonuclease
MAYLYILYSSVLDRYYIGHTANAPEIRLAKHLSKHGGFTSHASDWELVYNEYYETKELAYAREREIKKWKSRKKIEQLLER